MPIELKMRRGFSLIELAVVVVITGVIALVVVYFSTGYFMSSKTEEVIKWVSDLKQAVNKASSDNVSISSLTDLRDYLVVPKRIQEMNPQLYTSRTVSCYNSSPMASYRGYVISLNCGDLCTTLRDRLSSLGFCVSLSSGTLMAGVR
jgi:prepilin-type N-terminal cleavage/methylation domain-containing protein